MWKEFLPNGLTRIRITKEERDLEATRILIRDVAIIISDKTGNPMDECLILAEPLANRIVNGGTAEIFGEKVDLDSLLQEEKSEDGMKIINLEEL